MTAPRVRFPGEAGELSVAVVVPSYRRPEQLERCLRALAAQRRPADRVVVVVRDADAETIEAVLRLHREGLAFEQAIVHRPGQIAAIEAGLALCREDIVAHTDDDAAPRPDWLERLVSHYGPDVGGVGGRDVIQPVQIGESTKSPVVGRVTWFGRTHGNHHAGTGPARDVDVLKGVNMSLRRELWRLDSRLRGEGAQIHMEVTLCLPIRRDGLRLIFDPEAIVDHYPARRFDENDRDRPTLKARAEVEFNYAYALARYLPPWRVAPAALYQLGVGTRWAPGLVAWLEGGVRRPLQLPSTARLFAVLSVARIAGLAAGLRR